MFDIRYSEGGVIVIDGFGFRYGGIDESLFSRVDDVERLNRVGMNL